MSKELLKKYRFVGGELERQGGNGVWAVVAVEFDWEKFSSLIPKWIHRHGIEPLITNPLYFSLPTIYDKFRGRITNNLIESIFSTMGIEHEDEEKAMELRLKLYAYLKENYADKYEDYDINEFNDEQFERWQQEASPRNTNVVIKMLKENSSLKEFGVYHIEILGGGEGEAGEGEAGETEVNGSSQQQQQQQQQFKLELDNLMAKFSSLGVDAMAVLQEHFRELYSPVIPPPPQIPMDIDVVDIFDAPSSPNFMPEPVDAPELMPEYPASSSSSAQQQQQSSSSAQQQQQSSSSAVQSVRRSTRFNGKSVVAAATESESEDDGDFSPYESEDDEWGKKKGEEEEEEESEEEAVSAPVSAPAPAPASVSASVPAVTKKRKASARGGKGRGNFAIARLMPQPNNVARVFLVFNGMSVAESLFIEGNVLAVGNEIMILQAIYMLVNGNLEFSHVAVIPNNEPQDVKRAMRYRLVATLNHERARLTAMNFQVSNFVICDGQFAKNNPTILQPQQLNGVAAQLPPGTRLLLSVAHKFENLLSRFHENFRVLYNGRWIDSQNVKHNYADALIPQNDVSKQILLNLFSFCTKCNSSSHIVTGYFRECCETMMFDITRDMVVNERANPAGFIGTRQQGQHDELIGFLDLLVELRHLFEALNRRLTLQNYQVLFNFAARLRTFNFVAPNVQYGIEIADIIDNILEIYNGTRPAPNLPGIAFVPYQLSMKIPYMVSETLQGDLFSVKSPPFHLILDHYLAFMRDPHPRQCSHGFGNGVVDFVENPHTIQHPVNDFGIGIPNFQIPPIIPPPALANAPGGLADKDRRENLALLNRIFPRNLHIDDRYD